MPHHADLARAAAGIRAAEIELIGKTTTKTGLEVECALDERTYDKGNRIKKAAMEALDIKGDAFNTEPSYVVKPRTHRNPQRLSLRVPDLTTS